MRRQIGFGKSKIEYELLLTDRRSMECRVTAEGVRVFAPKGTPARLADEMVLSRADWILSSMETLRQRQERLKKANDVSDGMTVPIEGRRYTLELRPGKSFHAQMEGGRLVLCGAKAPDQALRNFLIALARQRLTERVAFYAPRVGCRPGRISIREQRTRWGSCSGKGNLNFNWKLIMAPPGALNYIVVHELCHLREFNHSPAFWALVERHCPDFALWKKFLSDGWPHPFP